MLSKVFTRMTRDTVGDIVVAGIVITFTPPLLALKACVITYATVANTIESAVQAVGELVDSFMLNPGDN